MALRDVKEYYINLLQQYIDGQNDLKDFEQALKDGYITEDKLEEVKIELNNMKVNVDRLAYVEYLLELPNRHSKRAKYEKQQAEVIGLLHNANATEDEVIHENDNLLKTIKESLKSLTTTK